MRSEMCLDIYVFVCLYCRFLVQCLVHCVVQYNAVQNCCTAIVALINQKQLGANIVSLWRGLTKIRESCIACRSVVAHHSYNSSCWCLQTGNHKNSTKRLSSCKELLVEAYLQIYVSVFVCLFVCVLYSVLQAFHELSSFARVALMCSLAE